MVQEYSIEQLNHGRKVIDFMRCDTLAFIISGLLLMVSIIIICVQGFNWGLDFTGGTLIEINLEKPVNLDTLRDGIVKSGFQEPILQHLGSSREIIVRMATVQSSVSQQDFGKKLVDVINKTAHQNASIKRIDLIGPSVGSDLVQRSEMALLSALIAILIYIGFRFEWRLALGTVLALSHDVIINCGILSLFHIEIDLTIVASLMSVISYSLNDKIVVFDRIRENFRKINQGSSYDIINVSLTQTLSRTLITSIITLAMILILFIFGGTLLKGFSLTMLIGVIIGTVSSIYISSALSMKLGMKREHMLVHQIEKEGANQPVMLP